MATRKNSKEGVSDAMSPPAKLYPHHWRRARWQKIWYMVGSLLVALGLAIAHDLFYRYISGRNVDTVLSQTWVTNIGTALAFIVRMFLVIAAGIAFVQHQWKTMKARPFEVEEIDNMSGMVEDIFALLHARMWVKVPTLVMIAVISWLLPVAAVFPPGTLRVANLPTSEPKNEPVPRLAFTNNSNWNTWQGRTHNYNYADAAPIAYRAALAAATSGKVLSIPHGYQNESYYTTFFGPALQCSNASMELTEVAVSHVNYTPTTSGIFYTSVVGGDDHQLFNVSGLRCDEATSSKIAVCYRPTITYDEAFEDLDNNSTDAAKLWVMLNHNLTECHLYNAKYDVHFEFSGVQQSTTIRKLEYHNPVAANFSQMACGRDGYPDHCLEYSTQLAYQAVMQVYGSLFVGALWGDNNGTYSRYQTFVETLSIAPNWSSYSVPEFQADMVELFSNVTLSMLSFSALQENSTVAASVSVTVTTYPAVYEYQPLRLWLAYGISIVLTAGCTIVGFCAISSNGASYSNKFSTFVRITKNSIDYNLVSVADDGANPCPENLKRAQVTQQNEPGTSENEYDLGPMGIAG